ncbi:hypothetical protein, partial [Glaesserella parasuis]|uniref:hypothetical protein n=1 Tax=Glaesserella parasuis TaxID=738 RepID=UPI001BE0570B
KNGQFFVHISKRGPKTLYYRALSHFLATNLSITPVNIAQDIKETATLLRKINYPSYTVMI